MGRFTRIALPFVALGFLIVTLASLSAQDPQQGKDVPKDAPGKDAPSKDVPTPKDNSPATGLPKDDRPPNIQWPSQFDALTLDQWMERLDIQKTPDPSTRKAAILVVPQFGPTAKKAIPMLINLMNDPDDSVKLAALMACTTHPYEDPDLIKKTVAKVNGLLKHNDESVRLHAAMACNRLGPIAKSCVPTLCSEYVLKCHTSYELRTAGALALGQVAFDDKLGSDPQAVSALANALTDKALSVRLESLTAIMFIGIPNPAQDKNGLAAQLLMKTLLERTKYEKDDVVKMWVRVCLMRFDSKQITQENIRAISANLKGGNEHLQVSAAKALGCMGLVAKSTIPDLIECLQKAGEKQTLYTIVMCMFALGQMGADASIALPEIQKYVNHENPIVKDQAMKSMERINAAKANKK
jgi:HEAT repeat protein